MRKINSILFVTYHFPPEIGGIQTRIANYCENLTKRGIGVTVLFPSKRRKIVRSYTLNGASVICLPGSIDHLTSNTHRIIRIMFAKHLDVVHVFTGASTVLGLFALIAGRLTAVSTNMSIFGREDVTFPSKFSRICFILSAELSNTITTNSEATKMLLPARFRSKTKVLLGGAPIVASSSQAVSSDLKIVLFVGRLAKRKGVDDLVEAFANVTKQFPSARLVIVGDGSEGENLRQKTAVLKLSNVEFKGTLLGESLQRVYEECSICVLPSKTVPEDTASEGLGLTLIEASMHGKALVGTNHGGIPEIINDGVNGLLVPEHDIERLTGAILRLLGNDEIRNEMGKKALQIAQRKFSWKAATDRLIQSYV